MILRQKEITSLDEIGTQLSNNGTSPSAASVATATNNAPSEGALSYAEQKEVAKQRRKLEQAVKEAEKHIEQLEAKIAEVEEQLSTPEGAANVDLFTQHGELRKQLAAAEEVWSEAVEALGE